MLAFSSLPTSPHWLKNIRQRHHDAFLKFGFPTRRQENWKYLNLSSLANMSFKPATQIASTPIHQTGDYYTLVFSNGQLVDVPSLPEGVILCDIHTAIQKYAKSLLGILDQAPDPQHPFFSQNTALFSSGFFLHVPQGVRVDKPFHCIYNNQEDRTMSHIRNIVILEDNSQLNLFEHFKSQGCTFENHVNQILLKKDAVLHYDKLQQSSSETYHIANTTLLQFKNSSLYSRSFSLGGQLSRDDVQVQLNGQQAACYLNGLYLTRHHQQTDHHLYVEHNTNHTLSHQVYKGILNDHSRAVFNGKVLVKNEAFKARATQSNPNILLSSQAEIDTKPELEIYNDDVKCTHGATVGQLDPSALFYLKTRGMPEVEAQQLLLHGFIEDILSTIKHPAIQAEIKQATWGAMPC